MIASASKSHRSYIVPPRAMIFGASSRISTGILWSMRNTWLLRLASVQGIWLFVHAAAPRVYFYDHPASLFRFAG